jgi:mediator of RNA polymerase II transcription subunit 8
MQKEERQLEIGLEGIIQRVNELRNAINTFILKLESEYTTLTWLGVLDNFALLSGHINALNKLMKNDKMPALRNLAVFPLRLAPDRDPELEKLTEGRVAVFNHEVAPLYLRTKPDPEVEEKITLISDKANKSTAEALLKMTNPLNKISSQAVEQVKNFKENLDSDGQKHSLPQLSLQSDTNALIAAVIFGKGIKPSQRPATPSSGNMQQGADQRMAAMAQAQQGSGVMQMNKAPSSIKTNIKAAGIHPYGR